MTTLALSISSFSWHELTALAGLGLAAGFLGGLAGVGGSMLILPALGLIFRNPDPQSHHLYHAVAMTTNIVVAIPAALRHRKRHTVRYDLLRHLLPSAVIAIIAGVLLSNAVNGSVLKVLLAAFMAVYVAWMTWHVYHQHPEFTRADERHDAPRLWTTGIATGGIAGLLGLGGGVVSVPLLQWMSRTPLKMAIGTSAALMCVTAPIGAGAKLLSLSKPEIHQSASSALLLAACLAPGACVGAVLGAESTHRFPLWLVRSVIVILLVLAASRLGFTGGREMGWW